MGKCLKGYGETWMSNRDYELRYLPLFYEDLNQTVQYIAFELENRKAAEDLIDAVETAILERLPMAESFEQYPSPTERRYPYYRIYVGNFIVFYVVIDEDDKKIMEVRRFLYMGRNIETIL